MKVSIALCTYNGARYLPEQLESLLKQTRLPDELVAVDDGSQDDTVDILREFAARAPFAVRIEQNAENLGVIGNFEKAIGLCTGDIIAFCDQDDLWRPEKLARIEEIFSLSPDTAVVFSDAEIIDENGKPVGYRLWPCAAFGKEQKRLIREHRAFEALAKYNFITGCTMAFRSSLRPIALPLPVDAFAIHDGWIALVAATLFDIDFIDEPLVGYRQHPGQEIGVEAPGTADRWGTRLSRRVRDQEHYKHHLRHLERVREKLLDLRSKGYAIRVTEREMEQLEGSCWHLRARIGLPESRLRRLPAMLRELLSGRYHKYSSGLRSAAADLLG